MKDAFGGTIMLYVLLVFLAIYVVFISLTLTYAKAFKLKNQTIEIIEKYEGLTTTAIKKVEAIETKNATNIDIEVVNNNAIKNTCYYVVKTDVDWQFPFLNISGTWQIKGETRTVSGKCDIK